MRGNSESLLVGVADRLRRGVKEFDSEVPPLLLLRLIAYLGDEKRAIPFTKEAREGGADAELSVGLYGAGRREMV